MHPLILGYIAACCLLYPIVWIVTDPRPWPEPFISQFRKPFLTETMAAAVVFCLQILQFFYFPLPRTLLDPIIIALGLMYLTVGLGLSIWAKLTMRKNWGLPMQHDFSRQNELVTTGPFAFSRNPIYIGLVASSAGLFLALRSPFIVISYFIARRFLESVKKEEHLLEKHFGKSYREYKKQVPRFIFR